MSQKPSSNEHDQIDERLGLMDELLAVHEGADSAETVERVVDFSRSVIGCDDAGVLLVHTRRRIETAAATSSAVARAHDLQVELDEGPCLDALENPSAIYTVDDLSTDPRWPKWSAEVLRLGFRSVVSVPLATTERRYGSLNVYSTRPHAFDDDDIAVTMVVARHASVALGAARDIEGLRRAIDARKLIGMAMGMLMERYGIDSDQAFDVLRRYSQHHNVKLRDVALQVVEQRGLPAE